MYEWLPRQPRAVHFQLFQNAACSYVRSKYRINYQFYKQNFMSENEQRTKSTCVHKFVGTNCKKCGCYNHGPNQVLKTRLFDSFLNCSAQKYLLHLRKRQPLPLENKEFSEGTWAILQAICDKFDYSNETLALGIYIFAKTFPKHDKDQRFWAACCLLVASKAIQLDRHVPYLNRYQKYSEKSFPQEDYEQAERSIFQEMGFDVQIPTFVSFLQFYITNGILFQKDCLTECAVRVIEDQLLAKQREMLKHALFLAQDPEKLALSLIKEVRIKHSLSPWPQQLEALSGYKAEHILAQKNSNILKPLCSLSNRAKQKLSSLSQHNTLIPLQNSMQLADHKPKLIRRKNESVAKSNLKENTFRPPPQVHQNLLSNIRKQNLSVSKCPASIHASTSNLSSLQKLIPLNFQSRRL